MKIFKCFKKKAPSWNFLTIANHKPIACLFSLFLLLACTASSNQDPSPTPKSTTNEEQEDKSNSQPQNTVDIIENPNAETKPSADRMAEPLETKSSQPHHPWEKPRELSSFQALLQHSPFSLATAEDSSPLSERYMLTGIITLDGEEQIFVMDRNDQSRSLLTKKPNEKGLALINIIHDNDPNKLKATIRANGETGVINNIDLADNNNKNARPGTQASPYAAKGGPASHLPVTPRYPAGYPGATHTPSSQNLMPSSSSYDNHRIIRRPPITTPSGNQNYQQGVPPLQNNYQQPAPGAYPGAATYPQNNYRPNTAPVNTRPPNNYQQQAPANSSYNSSVPSY